MQQLVVDDHDDGCLIDDGSALDDVRRRIVDDRPDPGPGPVAGGDARPGAHGHGPLGKAAVPARVGGPDRGNGQGCRTG